uniref:CUB domain-containing protein n=1 Tax=Haemonchus contortus TaxID=6289 RepID=A0A7I4YAL9_HAECO
MTPFRFCSWAKFLLIVATVSSQINARYDGGDCGRHSCGSGHVCAYGEKYGSGEIKHSAHTRCCRNDHCFIRVEPGSKTGLTLFLESITLITNDTLKLSQYFPLNNTETALLHYVNVNSSYHLWTFTAAVGVGFRIEYRFQRRGEKYRSSSFTLSFKRVGSDVKLCPYPLLRSSVNITNVPNIRRLGPIRCPVRVISSVPGREILLDFKDLGGTTFLERKENGDFRATPPGILKRQNDKIDFVLEGLSPYHPPRYNITFKELTEDPCYCDEAYVVVGTKPVHTTSPEFPITHCSKVRCKRRFIHNGTVHHDSQLTFAVTVHFLSAESYGYIQFYSDGITMDRLNDTHKDVRLVLTGDIMETEFVTDNSIGGHGYNMTVESIHLPTECLCPHKGVKTMPIKADARMDIPEYCVTVYCEWIIPSITHDMKFLALFNFTSEADMLTVATANDIRQFSSKSRVLVRKEWKLPKNSQPVTISYKRDVRANSTLPSAMTSFLVSWMPSEGCYCDNSSIKTAVVGEWDVLTSPAYPLSYCNDMLCVTRIVAPEGHHVVLNITDFYTEPYNDVLTLFDGWNISGRHMEMFHGKGQFPRLIRNTNETLSLVFKSDHEVYYEGYRLLFSAESNKDGYVEARLFVYYSIIVITLLSIMLIAGIIVAVFRRLPTRPLYLASVSYSDRKKPEAIRLNIQGKSSS